MADALFDTTVFIDYARRDPGAQRLIERLLNGGLTASYSSLTVLELWIGSMSDEEEMLYRALLGRMSEAPLVASSAQTAAIWLRQAVVRGKP